ncbi:MAG: AMP-binding protein, partial [Fimbriimonadaceae bacterium]|nr:AMP-binding protein [Alphaproteobacteria bacterium]
MLTGDMLRRSALRFPGKPAIVCGQTSLTYRQLDLQANRLANAFLALGLRKGAKIAILSHNLPEYGLTFFAVARTGYVLTNVSILYSTDELAYVLDKADVEVLIFDIAFEENVAPLLQRLEKLKHLISIGASALDNVPSLTDFAAAHSSDAPQVEIDETDPFCMTYTGGTTGRPKGVLFSHRGRAVTAHTVMVEEAIDERDIVGIVTPLFHVAALNIMFQPAILAGATTVFLPKWSPEAFLDMVETTGMTANFMVPTQAGMLLNCAAFDKNRLGTWRKMSFAGAPMPDWVQIELAKRLPDLKLTQIYGQS